MQSNPQKTKDLVTFTEEILILKPDLVCEHFIIPLLQHINYIKLDYAMNDQMLRTNKSWKIK